MAAIAAIIQFVLFKFIYPSAGFINGDSYNYLMAAFWNQPINTYMIGYSKFLRLFSVFSSSDNVLVAFQYLSIQCGALFFLFTLFYFYNPGKTVQLILHCFMVLNPLFLYISNYVISDALFLALSLVWFGLLLWIIHRPTPKIILSHAVLILVAFTFRYNALAYPFISVLAFALSSGIPLRRKFFGAGLGFLLVSLFMFQTASEYKKLTGVWQYSPFSGWQWANNAMYAYRYVDPADRKPVPEKFKSLDNMIRAYFDSTRDTKKHPEELMQASTVYMWDPRTPLPKYQQSIFKHSSVDDFPQWASMGPLYAEYGRYIIKQYPRQFIRYFLWPNFNKYYATPVEFLDRYNSGDDTIANIAQGWFRHPTNKVKSAFRDAHVHALDFYPILAGMMNIVFLAGVVSFLLLGGAKSNPFFSQGLFMAIIAWAVNMGFIVFASSAALRFQAFPILMFTCFALLLIDYLMKEINSMEKENQSFKTAFSEK